jgi:hypothetical protein
MPPRSAEEKARKKVLFEERKKARQEEKAQKELEEEEKKAALIKLKDGKIPSSDEGDCTSFCYFLTLGSDAQNHILCFLPARDLGAVSMTCRSINFGMGEIRICHLLSRLNTHARVDQIGKLSVPIKFCENESEARHLLRVALDGSGDTGRLVTKKSKKGGKNDAGDADEYIAYARFLEEAVQGHAVQKIPGQKPTDLVSHICIFNANRLLSELTW